jgi:hypothetical protein
MKNTAKLIVVCIFALGALYAFLSSRTLVRTGAASFSLAAATPTPPNTKPAAANVPPAANMAANMPNSAGPANTAGSANSVASSGGKKIPKTFILGQDSQSEDGEVVFDHDSHAFGKYSPDGTKVMGCVECHHTDQPKSALKPPDVTSERDEVLTFEVFQKTSQKVTQCRTCHFQDGNVPEGKTMPTVGGKAMNNQLAFHINCNTCHDAAFKLRPELKTHKGFATSKDCAVCHKITT